MKLRLPNKLQAALVAAITAVSLTTLSSGAYGAELDPEKLLCTIAPGDNDVASITPKGGDAYTSTGAAFGGYGVDGTAFTTTGGKYLGLDSWDTRTSKDIKDKFGTPNNASLTMVFDAAITSYDTAANNALVYYGRNDTNSGYALSIVNGNWTIQWGGKGGLGTSGLTTAYTSAANTADTAKHNYILTFNNNVITAYQDDVMIAQSTGGNIVQSGGLDWTLGALTVNNRAANSHGYTSTISDIKLYSGVVTPSSAMDYVWKGTTSAWDTETQNWETKAEPGTPVAFVSGAENTVTFNANGQEKNVTLATTALVKDMTVTGAEYTLNLGDNSLTTGTLTISNGATLTVNGSGTVTIGSLTGTGDIIKGDSATMTINGDNSGFTGNLNVNAGTLSITKAASLGTGTTTVGQGAAILLTNNDMSTIGTLNVQGDGDLRLVTGKTDSKHGLRTVSAHNLKLQDNGSHNSRFVYENGSDLSGVNHLFFDGAQLWINGKNLEFTKAVTFNGSTFAGDSGNLRNAAIRQGNSNTVFSGAVEIAANTRLTWDADTAKTSDIKFAGTVRGGGDLELLHFRQSGTFTISGDASEYAGKITSDSSITLRVTDSGELALGDGSVLNGAVSLAGALTVNGSVTVNGSLTQTAGSITVNQDKSLTLGAAAITSAINSAGTVVFTQDITATGLQKVGEDVSYSVGADDAAATNNNYFSNGQRTESTICVVTGGTVTTGDHTVTQDSVAYALKADGTATGVTADGVDYSAFYQGQAGTTVNVSQLAATATKHGAELQTVQSIGAGGTPTVLNVDQDLAAALVAFSTVNIGSDVTYTGNLLVFGGMNTVSGQIDIAKVGFYSGYSSVTTFTDAPVVNGGVRFTSDAELGGVQVQANKLSGVEEGYYAYAANDYHYSVAASELSKEGADASDVANSLMVSRIHNSEETATGKLTLHAGAVAAVLNEVVATSGDVEFLNMAAANEGIGSDVPLLNNLVIGTDKTVSFYKEGAPANEGDEVAEATVTVAGTLTAGTGAKLYANLVMDGSGNGTPAVLDVHAMGGNGGLNMGSSVTLTPYNVALSDEDMAQIGELGFMGKYDLFNGVDSFIVGSNSYEQIGMSDAWVNARDVFSDFALPTDKDYYLFYSGANTTGGMGSNVGTIFVMQIPEPTTGTLSLLALAALCMRRRRK